MHMVVLAQVLITYMLLLINKLFAQNLDKNSHICYYIVRPKILIKILTISSLQSCLSRQNIQHHIEAPIALAKLTCHRGGGGIK